MRFYRNHHSTEGGSSGGFSFYTSKAEAEKAARGHDEPALEVAEPIDIEPTKAGILKALNHYAGHPDNG